MGQGKYTSAQHNRILEEFLKPIVRRLIAILLMLWLPLQTIASTAVESCSTHGAAQSTGAANAVKVFESHATSHAQHSPSSHNVQAVHHVLDPVDTDLAAEGPGPCSDCLAMCNVTVQAPAQSGMSVFFGAAPLRHGTEDFTSVGSDSALEPPIPAA